MNTSTRLRQLADRMGLDGFAEELREIAGELEAKAAPAAPQGTNWHAHHVIVGKAALQMVRNALRNDMERGLIVRGEMLEELDKVTYSATPAAPSQPAVPQGEPVAWQARFLGQEWAPCTKEHHDWVRREPKEFVGYEVRALCLCATPAAPSQPVTLTDDEIKRNWSGGACPPWGVKFARAIIAALREKEGK